MLVGHHQIIGQRQPARGQYLAAVDHINARRVEPGGNVLGDLTGMIQHVVALGHLIHRIDGGVLIDEQERALPRRRSHIRNVLRSALHGHEIL